MRAPSAFATAAERPDLPPGDGERFAVYGVMGLPFSSGHVLAVRRFPASSVAPAYTSVWHRDPAGHWVFWSDQAAEASCARYFAAGTSETRRAVIELSWPDDSTLRVLVPDAGLEWTVHLASTTVTRALNAMGRVMPDRALRARPVLRAMGSVAGRALRAGKLGMVGTTPNGRAFIVNPLRIWVVDESSAGFGANDLGRAGPLVEQPRLGDFWIPQRGIFAIGRAYFGPANSGEKPPS